MTPRELNQWGHDNAATLRPTGKATYRKPCPCGKCGRVFPAKHARRAEWEALCPYLRRAK